MSYFESIRMTDTVDSNNATLTPLLADAVFTGTSTDTFGYSSYSIMIHTDVAGELAIQYSPDGSDWHTGESYSISAGATKFFTPPLQERYIRIVYTNGGTGQSEFHLHPILRGGSIKPSSHNLNDNLNDDDDGELAVAVLKLRTAQDSYVSGAATNSGNFKVSLEEYNGTIATGGLPITEADTLDIDAFGRKRVSNTAQRYDIEFIYDKQPLLTNEITNNGTVTHNANTRDLTLSLASAGVNDVAKIQSNYYIPYTPGNSQLIELTGTLDNADIGGGTAQLFLRTKISGTVAETVVDQTNWDNPVANADWSTSQIFFMDFQSLKVGRIRYGLVRGGIPTALHEIHNDNTRLSGYWQSPSLPVYWKLYNDTTYTYAEIGYGDEDNAIGFRYRITANASMTMRAICGTVKSEGGKDLLDMPGYQFSADNNVTPITSSTTLVPILTIRNKTTFNSISHMGLLIPQSFELSVNNPVKYEVLLNASLTGASYADVNATNSATEYDVTASAVSGGTRVLSGYISTARNTLSGDKNLLGRVIMSAGNTLTICAVRTSTSNAAVLSSISFKEIR